MGVKGSGTVDKASVGLTKSNAESTLGFCALMHENLFAVPREAVLLIVFGHEPFVKGNRYALRPFHIITLINF